jgi:glycosyltransferase involved in cell wall biosynthesis
MPQVSVIIPVYNAEKTLHKCLDSLLAQTYKDIEILLIEDGSCDNSKKICEEYCAEYAFIKLFQQGNSGPATARNNGIDHAEGKYVYFVDADDYVEPTIVGSMVEAAEASHAEMVICSYFTEVEGEKAIPHSFAYKTGLYRGEDCEKIAKELISDVSDKRIPPYSWVRMILRSCLENPTIRYESGMIRSEDYHFFVRLHFRLSRIYILSEPLYHYVQVSTSITHRYVPQYWASVKKIYLNLKASIPSDTDVAYRLDTMLIQRTLIALNNSSRAESKQAFASEAGEILGDKLVQDAVNRFSWSVGLKQFGVVYVLLKLRLHGLVMLRYGVKYMQRGGRSR